ncbi:MAG: bacillithiol system protein YtxJ [Marinoscillum sp.]|jgi:bacillithiol system protein YtxJ
MTNITWNTLSSIEQLDAIDQESMEYPVLIFKHSIRCSISAATLNRFESKWDNLSAKNLKPYYLDLINHRDVSNEIASRYGINHQSPQTLIIVNGQCVLDNSHFGISFADITGRIKAMTV